ncbi:hypothetical protein FHS89_002775 [Rubricella aquisinus]|uniref:Uncharacterized protein n=1 Tax=Rubricella aquisinus TaxID=2028108 RepID=A0A840X4H2_9RHOB|nr:hypothetical protein [Rubricella aquisinus]MBB5516735.1 hypothetical protein [Rubricella aquisinus]
MIRYFLCAIVIGAAGAAQADVTQPDMRGTTPAITTVQTWPNPDSLPNRQLSPTEARMRLLVILAAEIAGADRLMAQNSRGLPTN